MQINVGSDFSGIGAFDFALKQLDITHRNIFACDIDKFVKIAYHSNHTPENWYTDVYERPIPSEPLDIYMTSPPCQAFSIAGNRKAEDDDRGVLFYNSLEFIRKNKPKVFIFENVKGLLSAEKGTVFNKWLDNLGGGGYVNGKSNSLFANDKALPYNIYYKVLNSKNYGVAQNRERVFIVGIMQDIDFSYDFPKTTDNSKILKDILEKNVDNKWFYSEKVWKNKTAHKERHKGFGYKIKAENQVASTLTTGGNGSCGDTVIQVGDRFRPLIPIECWRLQGFSDKAFNNAKNAGVSNTQLFKQAGNSITVNVLAEIIRGLLPIFEREYE